MSGDVPLELWIHKYKMEALSSVLAEQGSSVDKQVREMLSSLYADVVPLETQRAIRTRIDTEYAAEQAKAETAQKYTAFHVRENGTENFFQLGYSKNFLDIAKFLRSYLRQEQQPAAAALEKSFADLRPISAEAFDKLMELRMQNPNKVSDVFNLDFDKQEISTVDIANSWQTYSMEDVSAAVCQAYHRSGLGPYQYEARFENKLVGSQIVSAGHLSAREIFFAEEISEVDNLLNFYMETNFDVDAVFGTQVCTPDNDDWINVYANYDMADGQVCNELEIALHRSDGGEEILTYPLNAVEKMNLLRKMEDYCQQQTGQTLAEFSTQRLAEDITPLSGF